MPATELDSFHERHQELIAGRYDCVDRIVLNGYVQLLQSGGGFRNWWRSAFGGDDDLDNAHLMRWAGRFARRLRAAAAQRNVPVLEKDPDDRMHEIVQQLRPTDANFKGVFAISVHRAPNSVWNVVEYPSGGIHLERKHPWVNHYAFHILDPDWGHVTIKICPHPPFNVQVALNGHEYVAHQAQRQNLAFQKEQNCFTDTANLAELEKIAETLRLPGAEGRLIEVCERWLSTACLCFLMPVAQQQELGLRYNWSIYQMEFSRNLLFAQGGQMEQLFQSVIDRTRCVLDVRTIRTLFGNQKRPFFRRDGQPNFALVVERPTYDLTVFKVHCGLLTLKIYTKGERVLRIEAIVHNAKKEFSTHGIGRFAQIADALRSMVVRFLGVLQSVDACWISDETWDRLPEPSQLGESRVAGVDLNRSRMRTVIAAVLSLSTSPRGFRAEQVAARVSEILGFSYTARQASYDLRKLRGKELVRKIAGRRSYEPTPTGLRSMVALGVLRDQVLAPLLSGRSVPPSSRPRNPAGDINQHYKTLQYEIHQLMVSLGLAL